MNLNEIISKIEKEMIEFAESKMRLICRDADKFSVRLSPLKCIVPYDQFYIRKKGSVIKLPQNIKIKFANKGILPLYLIEGSYFNNSITHCNYDGTHFDMYLSTNYGLWDYFRISKSNTKSDNSKQIINPNSILFLRNNHISFSSFEKIINKNENLGDFCLRRIKPGEKNKILELAAENDKLSFHYIVVKSTRFSYY